MDTLLILIIVLIVFFLVVAVTRPAMLKNSSIEGYRDAHLFVNYKHMKDDWYPWSNYSIYDADANLLGYPYYDNAY